MDVDEPSPEDDEDPDERRLMRSLKHRYEVSSSATTLSFKVPPPPGSSREYGFDTLVVPGWIRERATELLFDGDELGEAASLPHAILACVLKVSHREWGLHALSCSIGY